MKTLFISLLLLQSLLSYATIYYVSSSGSDFNAGLAASSPWQTLAKVNASQFKPGDQILFCRGDTLYGSITTIFSGSPDNPITFSAYGTGPDPVITGFTNVSDWTNAGGNIWESNSPVSLLASCNMVTINGVNTAMGRYPKVSDKNRGYLTYQSHSGKTSVTSSDLTGTSNWAGAEVVIRNQSFHLKRSHIISHTGSVLTFEDIGEGFTDGNGFFFQNDIRCCTQQNEWYYNPSTKKISIYSTSKPTNVRVASMENLIRIRSNNLVFTHITFTGANGCAFYGLDHKPRYNHVTITDCTFSDIGVCAIYTRIDDLFVTNNTITNCNMTAIETTSGNRVEISYNIIRNIGLLHGMRNNKVYTMTNCAVDCGNVSGWTVKNNSICNVGFNGIAFWASDHVLIEHNFIDTFCTVLDDGGAIYTYTNPGNTCHDVKINGNICINGISAVEGATFVHHAHGIYLDYGSTNIEICYNSVANVAGSGIHWTSAGHNYAHHNTVFNASESQFSSGYFGEGAIIPTGDRITHNLFIAKTHGEGKMDYQKCFYIYFSGSDPTSLIIASATLDSNCYARPIADDKVFFVSIPGWNKCYKTLAEWQAFSGQDAHSHKSSQPVTSVNDFDFEYNATGASKTISLSHPMVDIKGGKYASTITLQPYTSMVLMKDLR